ncbi:hypothetical protein K1719_046626 [Acacia pycnantha]|nr:hypothetical protein K1719_046626 [Acacia pycnantha]
MATLHHQIIYHLQNHSLDLYLPNSIEDALVAILNRADGTSIIQIPRQIPKEELSQLMPMEWISNYEKLFHGIQLDVYTTTPPTIKRLPDGTKKTIFTRPSASGLSMYDPNCECNTPEWWEDSDDKQGLCPSMVRPNEEEEEIDQSFVEHRDDTPPRQDQNYKPTSGPWFTFDDISSLDWRHHLQEFSALIDLQITGQ